MIGWQEDKKWSDKFLPEIKSILGQLLIGEPAIEEDQEKNTDLIVLKMEVQRIACRVRQYKYYEKYKDEFTIRSKRPTGTKTELTKVIEGWGDYIFYAIANNEETRLAHWILGELNAFRLWFNQELYRTGQVPGIEKYNFDNSSAFRAFKYGVIPKFIKAHSDWPNSLFEPIPETQKELEPVGISMSQPIISTQNNCIPW